LPIADCQMIRAIIPIVNQQSKIDNQSVL